MCISIVGQRKSASRLSEEKIVRIGRPDKQDQIKMKPLYLIIASAILVTVAVAAHSFAGEYWIVADARGVPSVTDKYPAYPSAWASIRGPFKYYDEAVRDMGTGQIGGRPNCDFTGLCVAAKQF
jgi:hypothetical protein